MAVPVGSAWYTWGPKGGASLPQWLGMIYAGYASGVYTLPQGQLIHLTDSNLQGTADYRNLNGFFNTVVGSAAGVSTQVGPAQWGQLAEFLNSQQCPEPSGDGAFASLDTAKKAGANWLQGLVAALKTQVATDSAMRKSFWSPGANGDPGSFWGLWSTSYNWSPASSSFVPYVTNDMTPIPSPGLGWGDAYPLTYHWYDSSGGTTYHDEYYWAPDSHVLEQALQRDRYISAITPAMRVPFAVNSGSPKGSCDAAWQLTQAMALSCVLNQDVSQNLTGQLTEPPQLQTPADLAQLNAWLKATLKTGDSVLQNAYVENVPALVVASTVATPGALSGTTGTAGTTVVQASNSLIEVYKDWNTVMNGAHTISNSIDQTTVAINTVNVQTGKALADDTIEQLNTIKAVAEDVAQIVTGVSNMFKPGAPVLAQGAGLAEAGAGATALVTDTAVLNQVQVLETDDKQLQSDGVLSALLTLQETATSASTDMSEALLTLRQSANDVTGAVQTLSTDASQAAYYAGKAEGLDVWNCAAPGTPPVECLSHVNTVLNRRYAGYQIRYQQALTQAKALGYEARLAIEQRIGYHLNDITTAVGPLDPPSTWADQICSLQGINFANLNQEYPDAGTSPAVQNQIDQALAAQYADGFVGDWVQKLTDFVNYYNIAYPEQDGSDSAVLSLREDLMGGSGICLNPSPNLLSDSSKLYNLADGSGASVIGWTMDSCATTDATCLQVAASSSAFAPPNVGPGGVSWLSDQPRPAPTGGIDTANQGTLPGSPDGYVSQVVLLNTPGTYLLSWWDQARDANGAPVGPPSGGPLPAYHVTVYDSSWTPVAGFSNPPTPSADGTVWSARNVISFQVATPDVYHVAFGASGPNGNPGSVAIADVQLELATSSGTPSPYVDTGDSGQVNAYECASSPSAMRAAFKRGCDPDGTCYYDLTTPITINTQTMTANGMSLAGKLAVGNFNFRHVDVALNLVGTGVINCSQTGSPDCYGSAYIDYTLTHVADAVGVLGYDGQYRTFDFDTASLDHAKALTAERYLTEPLSSTDQQLVNQFLQQQFRGRPMDGVYNLRIYDSPTLQFQNLQDVQIIVNYDYWSRVTSSSAGP